MTPTSSALFVIDPGRRVLITGGGSGFGLGVAQRLIELGIRVAIADIERVSLERAAATLGAGVMTIGMDVTDGSSVQAGVAAAVGALGGLDTVVNSAGVCFLKPFLQFTEADWDHIVDVNLKGTFLVCQATIPHLIGSGRGRIVNLSSVAGRKGVPLNAPYVASKFGVIGLTETLALEFASEGLLVNAVLPTSTPGTTMGQGLVAQKLALGMARDAEELAERSIRSGFPLGRLGEVADTVDAILFLLSSGAGYITGHSLLVDGGSALGAPMPKRSGP